MRGIKIFRIFLSLGGGFGPSCALDSQNRQIQASITVSISLSLPTRLIDMPL